MMPHTDVEPGLKALQGNGIKVLLALSCNPFVLARVLARASLSTLPCRSGSHHDKWQRRHHQGLPAEIWP